MELGIQIDLRFGIDPGILIDKSPEYDFFRRRDFVDQRHDLYVKRSMYSGENRFVFDEPRFDNLPFDGLRPGFIGLFFEFLEFLDL